MIARFLTGIFLAFIVCFAAVAEERITSFDVVVDVQKNGDYIVTETIAVEVEGREIRRGIFRDIPRFLTVDKSKVAQKFKVLSVERDGNAEKYETSNEDNAYRIRIGKSDTLLDHGHHIYKISYKADNQIRRRADADEVYWNTTGTYWSFPIDTVTAKIILPDETDIKDVNAYTGQRGSTRTDYKYSANGKAHSFETTRQLSRREGMTVSLIFEKGVISPLSSAQKRGLWWIKNASVLVLSLSLFGILGFYMRAWSRVGRDPVKDPVFARYEPPADYSPAAVSHIHFKGFSKNRALIASLMSLAIKKRIHIDADKKKTTITTLEHDGEDLPDLSPEQADLLEDMFSQNEMSLTLDRSENPDFHRTNTAFQRNVKNKFSKDYFRWNAGYPIAGAFFSIIALIAAAVFSFGVWKPTYWIILACLVILNILFVILMPAPTKKGQKIMSEIEGFKLYLETAEKLSLNAVKVGSDAPPMMTVKRYEKFLPYAVALGVEKPWTKHFQAALPVEASSYAPTWTTGHMGGQNISRSLNSMVSNISSGVSHAAPQASNSSGGGGGGFSGGGGGGGGGGGW
jgi:uncharacterized membrane protein